MDGVVDGATAQDGVTVAKVEQVPTETRMAVPEGVTAVQIHGQWYSVNEGVCVVPDGVVQSALAQGLTLA